MTLWKSTMGAPLSADEETAILSAWYRLEALAQAQSELTEPVDMLDHVTDLIMAAYEVRRAIGEGWNAANARAWPTPQRATQSQSQRPLRPHIPTDLNITEEELLNALAHVRAGDTP